MKILILMTVLVSSILVSCASADPEGLGTENNACFENKTCKKGLKCRSDKCVKDKCYNVECGDWAVCDDNSGECKAKEGYCKDDNDCTQEEMCNTENHLCESKNPCNPNPCIEGDALFCEVNEDKYICKESPCIKSDCDPFSQVCEPVNNDGKWDYKCLCKENFTEVEGTCMPVCDYDCEDLKMECQAFEDGNFCTSYDLGADCERAVNIIGTGVWFGDTRDTENTFNRGCDNEFLGEDVVYVLDTENFKTNLNDGIIKLTLTTDDDISREATPVMYWMYECGYECKDAVYMKDNGKIELFFDLNTGPYYIVVDSVNAIAFDYTLKVTIEE